VGKDWGYYHVDCGHFPVQIKLCFSNDTFQKVLLDHGIMHKATALDVGIAETHYLTDGKEGIIVLVFDMNELKDEDPAYVAGVIAHEATHCVCRVFEHIGEEPEEIGEESRAYLTEHIVKQITTGIAVQRDKDVRKADRTVSNKKSKSDGGPVLQVDKHDNGSPGSDSVPKSEDPPGGAENKKRGPVRKTKDSVPKSK